MSAWSPRGAPTWPGWKSARPGTCVRHVRTGAVGTFERKAGHFPHEVAVVLWESRFGRTRGRVVAPAYELEPVPAERGEA